jgi:hypothetical protein
MERRMSNVQSNLPVTDGASALPEAVQDASSGHVPMSQGEPGMDAGADQGAGPYEHSLLSRPAAPQYRRSLFRR